MNVKDKQAMNVAFTCNDRYVKYVSVTMISILENHAGSNIHFYLICNDISEKSRRYIDQIGAIYRFEISYLSVNNEQFSGIKKSFTPHVTDETNFRYFIADLIPDVDKLLFLDGDLVVNGSLEELYHINLENYLVAVAKDPLDRGLQWWFEKFNIPRKYPYLNTGVFLVNMKEWRKQRLGKKLLDTAHHYGNDFWFPDQDAINVLCYDKNFLIGQKYNFCPELHWDNLDDRARAEKQAVVYHWAGPQKPWISTEYKYADIFWKYARLTPFYAEILYENVKVAPSQHLTQQVDQVAGIVKDVANYAKNRRSYYRCKILGLLTFGERHRHYTEKKKMYHEKMRNVRRFLK